MSEPKDLPVLTEVLDDTQPFGPVPGVWSESLRERLYTHLTPLVEKMADIAVEQALAGLRQELKKQLQAELETELERALAIALLDKEPFRHG